MRRTPLAVACPLLLLLPSCASSPERVQAPPPPDAIETGAVQAVSPASIVAPVGDAVRAEPTDEPQHMPGIDEWKTARFGMPVPRYERPASELTWDEIARELIAMRSPELAQYRTPLAGLALCGRGVHPGALSLGGSGWLAAGRLLKG